MLTKAQPVPGQIHRRSLAFGFWPRGFHQGRPLYRQRLAPAPAAGEDALGPRVQRVPDPVPEQVEGQRRDDQRGGREDQEPP